jgi:DNA-binding NarL/FixJ family response regulator
MLGMGRLELRRGNYARSLEHMNQALQTLRQIGARRVMCDVVDAIAMAGAATGRYAPAAGLLGSTMTVRALHAIGISAHSKQEYEDLQKILKSKLNAQRYEELLNQGKARPLEVAVEDAFALSAEIIEHGSLLTPAAPVAGGQSVMARAIAESGLTRRELEVLQLLARGFSDKKIADELYISPRTAMTHVSNILSKFGVNKRTAAASVALRMGIVDSISPFDLEE